MPGISVEAFNHLTNQELPLAAQNRCHAEAIGNGTARVCLPFNAALTRPGGTISGPAMMALTDYGMYAALMGAIGEEVLAVAQSLRDQSGKKVGKPPSYSMPVRNYECTGGETQSARGANGDSKHTG